MIPIVFIHNGDSFYLRHSFYQVRKMNPDADIFVLGDKVLQRYSKYVKYVDISEYKSESIAFQKVYKHISINDYNFELFCIQRWFILKEFLEKNNIERCLHLDSDVLLYTSSDELSSLASDVSMTITSHSGHTSIQTITGLKGLCAFITGEYAERTEEEIINRLMVPFNKFFNLDLRMISDMSLLWGYMRQNPNLVKDSNTFSAIRGVIDLNFSNFPGEPYVEDKNVKKVIWENNMPFYIKKATNKKVKMLSLHFQGAAKKQISRYVRPKTLNFYFNGVFFRGGDIIRKTGRVLSTIFKR